jgi:hypothetical protein
MKFKVGDKVCKPSNALIEGVVIGVSKVSTQVREFEEVYQVYWAQINQIVDGYLPEALEKWLGAKLDD